MKKIMIISYMFYPENNPRAFRAYELAKELSKQNEVVVITKKISNRKKENFRLIEIESGFFLNKNQSEKSEKSVIAVKEGRVRKKIFASLAKIYNYFFYSREIEFSYEIVKKLNNMFEKVDVVISVANPFACHIGSWYYLKNKRNIKLILDYGDPFYMNPVFKLPFYFKSLEKTILKRADWIVLPVDEARKAFSIFGEEIEKKIKIVPQGININDIEIEKYEKNNIPTFMYAGAFYEKIRNPINFFEKLNEITENYKMFLYTNMETLKKTDFGLKILEEIKKNNRIELKDKIPRKECINKMSKMDFLINIENLGGVQVPSKLIDYGIAKRPVYSFNQENFNQDIFREFLVENYKNSVKIDISPFDIKKVTEKFEELF